MRAMKLVAGVAALTMAYVSHAEALGTPVALVGVAEPEAVDALAGPRPGLRLSPVLNLRLDVSLDHDPRGLRAFGGPRTQLIDPSRRRRLSSMVDYYPDAASGFHLSLGMHRAPKRARWTPGADSGIAIFMPRLGNPLMVRTNVARSSPMMMAGWSGLLAHNVSFGIAAGAMQEHGKALKVSSIAFGRQQASRDGWSRVGEVAQVNLAFRF